MATVQDILDKKGNFVATVGRGETVLDAAREMNARHIGALVVTEDEKLLGVFSERDILTRVVASQLDPARTTVDQVMTAPVVCCQPNTPLAECRALMTVKRIRHLPVVVESKLVGIITSGDLMAREVVDQQETIEHLHRYIYGYHP